VCVYGMHGTNAAHGSVLVSCNARGNELESRRCTGCFTPAEELSELGLILYRYRFTWGRGQ